LNIIKNIEVDRFINDIKLSGVEYFSLGIIKGNQIFAIFSSPTWQKFYLENQCFDYDPVIKTAYVNYDMPVDWRSVTVLLKKEAFIMEARSELTGCQEGFSMIQKINRETSAILAFGGTKDFSTVMNAYATYQSEVTRLAELLSSIYFPPKKKKKEK
jgi:hypothetical protein